MNYEICIQRTLDYIEEHLEEKITLEDLARVACFSPFHFHRVFQILVGEPVMDYVRKRRLTCAAEKLQRSDQKVIDIALEVGFQYHESFNRAFKKCFGLTPKQYRGKEDDSIPLYQKAYLTTNLFLGGFHMEPKLVTKPAFNLLGYELKTRNTDGENNREIPKFWQHYLQNKLGCKIPNPINQNEELGLCTDFNPATGEFVYIIGMEVKDGSEIPEGMTFRSFPEMEYAVFTTPKTDEENFSSSIQNTWVEIFSKWFPKSGYEHDGTCEFELYDERCYGKEGKQMDIYIPVKKQVANV